MTDSDIIHPRNQGGDPEAGFIEPWAERRAKRAKAKGQILPPNLPKGARSNARKLDPDFERKFRAMWAKGVSNTRMKLDLGISETALNDIRRAYGLEPRVTKGKKPRVFVCVGFSPEEARKMGIYCSGRYQTRSHFIRELVKRELDRL
jgi:hypothetical protein